jgi:hypothetical protein
MVCGMATKYFIVRARDAFGDTWPLGNVTSGIDGKCHESLEAAKAVVAKYTEDKETRRAFRELNGWTKNSIRRLEVSEVTVS